MCGCVSGERRSVALMLVYFALAVKGYIEECNCNGKRVDLIAAEWQREFTSPGYPRDYTNDCHCSWLITGEKEKMNFTILDLNLEKSADNTCSQDTLTFYDGYSSSNMILKNPCFAPTSKREATFNSTSKYVYVVFRSDSHGTNRGFRISFSALGDGCSRQVKNLTAVDYLRWIASPHYPHLYPRDCVSAWRITSQRDVVKIKIADMRLETTSAGTCQYDNVQIFDGSDFNADVLTKLCTLPVSKSERVFISRSKHIYILFRSDSYVQNKGFKIGFRAKDYTEPSDLVSLKATTIYQTIQSPGYPMYYPPNAHLAWEITSVQALVRLTIEAVELEFSNSCDLDFVEIYDCEENRHSSDRQAPHQLTKLCQESKPYIFMNVSKKVQIRFKSDSGVERTGFRIGYQAEPEHVTDHADHNNNNGVSRKELTIIVISNLAIVVCLILIVYFIYRRKQLQNGMQPLPTTSGTINRADNTPICGNSAESEKDTVISEPPPYSAIAPAHFDEEHDRDYAVA